MEFRNRIFKVAGPEIIWKKISNILPTAAHPAARQQTPRQINRYILLLVYMVYAFLSSSAYFGWQSLSSLLALKGEYLWLCPTDSIQRSSVFSCEKQNTSVHALYTVCFASDAAATILSGFLMDTIGPKSAVIVGQLCSIGGWLLLGFSEKRFPAAVPSFVLIGMGAGISSLPTFTIAYLFPGRGNSVIALLSLACMGSFIIPAILLAIKTRFPGSNFKLLILCFVILDPLLCLVLGFFFVPDESLIAPDAFLTGEELRRALNYGADVQLPRCSASGSIVESAGRARSAKEAALQVYDSCREGVSKPGHIHAPASTMPDNGLPEPPLVITVAGEDGLCEEAYPHLNQDQNTNGRSRAGGKLLSISSDISASFPHGSLSSDTLRKSITAMPKGIVAKRIEPLKVSNFKAEARELPGKRYNRKRCCWSKSLGKDFEPCRESSTLGECVPSAPVPKCEFRGEDGNEGNHNADFVEGKDYKMRDRPAMQNKQFFARKVSEQCEGGDANLPDDETPMASVMLQLVIPLKEEACTWPFAGLCVYGVVCALVINIYQQAANRFLSDEAIELYHWMHLMAMGLCLLFGALVDCIGLMPLLGAANCCGLCSFLCATIADRFSAFGDASASFFAVYLSAFIPQVYMYVMSLFHSSNFGRLVGIVTFVGGSFSLLSNVVYDHWITQALKGKPTPVFYFCVALLVLMFPLLLLVRVVRMKMKVTKRREKDLILRALRDQIAAAAAGEELVVGLDDWSSVSC